jgi:hypothetical protein
MRLPIFLFSASILALGPACSRPAPVQPLQHVSESGKLRVRFKSHFAEPRNMDDREAEQVRSAMQAEQAIVDQLRAAGYDVADHGKWDVKMTMSVSVSRERNFDPEYTHAEVTFLDHEDRVVDRIAFDMRPGAAPAAEPKRVANAVVNGVVESKKLSAYAEERRERRAKKAAPSKD